MNLGTLTVFRTESQYFYPEKQILSATVSEYITLAYFPKRTEF